MRLTPASCALFAAALLLAPLTQAANPLPLWPKTAPGEIGNIGEEADITKDNDGLVAGKRVIRLGKVSQPTMTVYPAPKDKANGAAVVICPGGAYFILAMDLEGTEIAEWFNSIGVTAVVVKYRVPAREGRERWAAALQDAQRAVSLTRSHAKEWNVDPKRVGIMGFSAGGHLSAVTSCSEKRTYDPVDDADQASCRPDFTILIYPAYLNLKDQSNKLSPELTVTSNTPPALLVQTEDDVIPVEGSLCYYLALKNAKVAVEMHLYPTGGHGYGLRRTKELVTSWPDRAQEWMKAQGLFSPKTEAAAK